jgi:hypothetical protein
LSESDDQFPLSVLKLISPGLPLTLPPLFDCAAPDAGMVTVSVVAEPPVNVPPVRVIVTVRAVPRPETVLPPASVTLTKARNVLDEPPRPE